MTLVQLRHLIALAETGSFSRAAELTHVTQPALSRSIRALEDELGKPLFDRVGRRAELTPLGHDAVQRARQLVFDARELHDHGRALAAGRIGLLRVGMGSGPGALLMTPLLLAVATERPRWRVDVARGATGLLVQRLRERTLDALVVDLRSLEPAADLKVERVREMRAAFMVRPGHPLARRRYVRFDELSRYPLASIPLSSEVARMLVECYGPAAHPDTALTIRCEEIASLVDATARSDAVLLSIRAAAPRLVELPVDPPLAIAARLGMVTLARRTEPSTLAAIRELVDLLLVDAARRPGGPSPSPAPAQPGQHRIRV